MPGTPHHDLPPRLPQIKQESTRDRREMSRLNAELGADRALHGSESYRIDTQTGDLFAWGAKQKRYKEAGEISVRRFPAPRGAYGIERSTVSRRATQKLGEYLYSGSFGRLTPARHGPSVLRNRILFLVFLAALVVYVLVRIRVR